MPVRAHHAFSAAFDDTKPINLQARSQGGVGQSHSWIWIDVKGKDGTVVNWESRVGPKQSLPEWHYKASLPVGTPIKLFGYQSKTGRVRASVFLWSISMGGSVHGRVCAGPVVERPRQEPPASRLLKNAD